MLFEPERHETLTTTPWSQAAARSAIKEIVADILADFDPVRLWPTHPLDDPKDANPFHSLYLGATGIIWALRYLQRTRAVDGVPDFAAVVDTLLARNREELAGMGGEVPSFLFGDVGVMLQQWQVAPTKALSDDIFAAVERNLHNPTLEQLWGSPGTLLAAIHLFEWTGERRFSDLLLRGVNILGETMTEIPGTGVWYWTQDMYGRRLRYLGGGHGFAGNVFPAFRGAAMLPADLVGLFASRTATTLQAMAQREDGRANWPAYVLLPGEEMERKKLVQDCHGAPGIICRLPNHSVPELDDLLCEGGELIWQAGPLRKGTGLCHGTAGNGYAFLKLYKRTGDRLWLDRARAFGMHAIGQADAQMAKFGQRRYSLWTGDPGVALYLQSCLAEDDAYPTLDVF